MPEELPDSGYDVENFDSAAEQIGSRVGQVIGSYTLYQEIGRGGMGMVYLAQNTSLDRYAAIKFLGRHLTEDPVYVDMFLREAKAAAKLNHPGIVQIYDAGCVDGNCYYMIMEFIDGHDLKSLLIEKKCFTVSDAVDYMLQAAAALGYAHKHRIIHRDIKPENLILQRDGKIKVCDLGLAKRMGEDSSLTQSGLVLGSPNYIAPERLRDPACNDPRMDIYSLGAAFYHFVTGKPPYSGEPAVVMASHLNDPVPDPQLDDPSLSDDLCKIIRKMMSKSPDQRYQTMEQVVVELTAYKKSGMHPSSALLKLPQGKQASGPRGASKQGSRPELKIRPRTEPGEMPDSIRLSEFAGFFKKFALTLVILAAVAGIGWYFISGKSQSSGFSSMWKTVPPLTILDFNAAEAPAFTPWASAPPEPEAACHATLIPGIGEHAASALKIEYDVINHDSKAGVHIPLNPVSGVEYRKLVLRVRGHALSPSFFFVELKSSADGKTATGMAYVENVGSEWKDVELRLGDFGLPSLESIHEASIFFGDYGGYQTRPKRGEIIIQKISLKK